MTNCTGCLDPKGDNCLIWTGKSIPEIGIENGKYYDTEIIKLADYVVEFIEQDIELECLYDGSCGTCDRVVKIPQSIKVIIDKICSLTSEDIKYTGPTYCLGSTMSGTALKMAGKKVDYSVNTNVGNSSVSYNLSDVSNNLPDDYELAGLSVVASGKKMRGKSVIKHSKDAVLSVPVENDRFPVNLDINQYVNTPSGQILLTKNISIPSPKAGDYSDTLEVKDYTDTTVNDMTQDDFNDSIASELCNTKQYLDSLREFTIASSTCFNIGGTGVKSVIGALAAAVEGLCQKIDSLEESIKANAGCTGTDPCGDSTSSGSSGGTTTSGSSGGSTTTTSRCSDGTC